jgi:eukaryotic-like serine/threonine-protein kinase
MAGVCAHGFVEALIASRVLEHDQRDALAELAARFSAPRDLAQELMRRGWLTPYQVNQLFLGRGGELILGHYVLLERLGEGGMGQVFKARQRSLDRIVALKVIRREILSQPNALPRFEREIRALAQLSHPNIVHAFDADHVDGSYFYAMEHVDGVDLARLIKQDGPLAVEQACDYIRQAALGLQHAHERGMVHRDIKPANLLVTWSTGSESAKPGSGTVAWPKNGGAARRPGSGALARPNGNPGAYRWGLVKLLDLGLAKWAGEVSQLPTSLTQLGSLMGTPDFIAPEQARDSRTMDIRTDIYSLGCTFYYLLAGRVPFPEGAMMEKLMAHQFEAPLPVEKVRRQMLLGGAPAAGSDPDREQRIDVPIGVRDLLNKMLAKRPEDRPQTPAEVASALGDFAHRGELKPSTQPAKRVAAPAVRRLHASASAAPPARRTAPTTPEPGPVVEPDSVAASSGAMTFALSPEELAPRRPLHGRGRPVLVAATCLMAGSLVLSVALGLGRGPHQDNIPPEKHEPSAPHPPETAFQHLQARIKHDKMSVDAVRHALLGFRTQFPGTPEALRASVLLEDLPSPLDRIDPKLLPKWQRFAGQPAELVPLQILILG